MKQNDVRRRLCFWATVLGVSAFVFAYGVLVGARQYPPYHALRAVKNAVLGSDNQNGEMSDNQNGEMSDNQNGEMSDNQNGEMDDEFRYNTVHPRYRETDPHSLLKLKSAKDVDERRSELISVLWSGVELPMEKLPIVEQGVTDKRYEGLANLARIDKLTVEMDFGIRSVCYHFLAEQGSGHLVIYHQGHRGDFVLGKRTIEELLRNGYDVVGMAMPVFGMNNTPVVHLPRLGRIKIDDHAKMSLLPFESGHPLRVFVEPVVVVVNYAASMDVETISMVGISGGGWTTVLSSAVDARIQRSYPVAGSLPIYLRSEEAKHWGDYEQTAPEVYRVANYLELYTLAATGHQGGARRHMQILNRYDSCCFFGVGYTTYEDHVINTVEDCGKGQFDVLLDETHREHKISEWTLDRILADLNHPLE